MAWPALRLPKSTASFESVLLVPSARPSQASVYPAASDASLAKDAGIIVWYCCRECPVSHFAEHRRECCGLAGCATPPPPARLPAGLTAADGHLPLLLHYCSYCRLRGRGRAGWGGARSASPSPQQQRCRRQGGARRYPPFLLLYSSGAAAIAGGGVERGAAGTVLCHLILFPWPTTPSTAPAHCAHVRLYVHYEHSLVSLYAFRVSCCPS